MHNVGKCCEVGMQVVGMHSIVKYDVFDKTFTALIALWFQLLLSGICK